MADRLAHGRGPEGHYRNATAVTTLGDRSHKIGLREFLRKFDHVVLSPVVAGTLIRPHIVGMFLHDVGTEPVLLLNDVIKVILRGPGVCVYHTAEHEIRKGVIHFNL